MTPPSMTWGPAGKMFFCVDEEKGAMCEEIDGLGAKVALETEEVGRRFLNIVALVNSRLDGEAIAAGRISIVLARDAIFASGLRVLLRVS